MSVIVPFPSHLVDKMPKNPSEENLGYFIIPRLLSSDSRYQGARLKYKHVLHILLEKAAFVPTIHKVRTEIINIDIGQFCVSERQLIELCNEGVKFQEDLVDKNTVHRAILYWKKCGFLKQKVNQKVNQHVNQKVNQQKSLLTVTVPGLYRTKKKTSEPESEPTCEPLNKNKEIRIKEIYGETAPFQASSLATSLLTDFYSSLFSVLPDFPKAKAIKTKTQYQAAERLLKIYPIEIIKAVIAYAHTAGGYWLQSCAFYFLSRKEICNFEIASN